MIMLGGQSQSSPQWSLIPHSQSHICSREKDKMGCLLHDSVDDSNKSLVLFITETLETKRLYITRTHSIRK